MGKAIIRNFVFDLGGVLYDLDTERCIRAFEAAGVRNIRHLVSATAKDGIFQAYETGELTTHQFRNEIRHLAGIDLPDAVIDGIWSLMLVGIPQPKLDLLLELNREHPVYLLSNTNDLHWQYALANAFEQNGRRLSDYFRQVFLSFEMHQAKPDPAIYQAMLQKAQLRAEETLFIDDSTINCQAASAMGIRTVLYRPGDELQTLLAAAV